MPARSLLNLAGMSTATANNGTITLGSALTGHLSFAAAGAVDGGVYSYAIKDGNAREVGWGVYTASGTTLTRNLIKSTTGSLLVLSGSGVEVYITDLADSHLPRDTVGMPGCASLILGADGEPLWGRHNKFAEFMLDLRSGDNFRANGPTITFATTPVGQGLGIKSTATGTACWRSTQPFGDEPSYGTSPLAAKVGFEATVRDVNLADATDDYFWFFGFTDAWAFSTDISADAIGIRYDRSTYSADEPNKLRAITKASSSQTATKGTVSYTADTETYLRVWIESSSSVKFYVNDTLIATHTTNIPSFTTDDLTPLFFWRRTAGTTARYATCVNARWWREI